MSTSVVVGYDQSAASEHALLLAAREAGLRQAVLTVVHAYQYARPTSPMVFPPPMLQEVYEKAAQEIAEEGVEHVRAQYPDLEVRAKVEAGAAAHALLTADRDARLLVVGNRGRGGFAGLLLGSVSIRVLSGASCPVIVARGAAVGRYDRVVAAVDIDDPGCADVLDFALDDAARRHAALVAVHVREGEERWVMEQNLEAAGLMKSSEEVAADLDERLAALVSRARVRHPDVETSRWIAAGAVGKMLIEESEAADLVVVGAHRRRGGHAGMHTGPVATTLLHHGCCPIAVVPHD
ncbi:MAG: universal stress protein [Catenulispora sp.]